jgi:type VI secretion system lysozyme-like protein
MADYDGRPPGSGLYDILVGHFRDGTPVDGPLSESDRSVRSVVDNLYRLLNTQSGATEHLTDFGLPAVPLGTIGSPKSTESLRRTLKKAIELYEPRLTRVHVEDQSADDASSRITLLIRGQLRDGTRVRLRTVFDHSDTVEVESVS